LTSATEQTERQGLPRTGAPQRSQVALSQVGAFRRPRTLALFVLVAGLVLTLGLATSSRLSYDHNEQRLLQLQTSLTASVLTVAVGQVEANLERVVGLSAEAPDPAAVFRQSIASSMAPQGPYASSALASVKNDQPTFLVHLGAASLRGLKSDQTTDLTRESAHTSSLVTTRAVKGDVQKVAYFVSASGPAGVVFVVAASQEFPVNDVVKVPRSSPDSDLNVALYFGKGVIPADLVFTNSRQLPLRGNLATAAVAFGDNSLTLVASSKGPLTGAWPRYTPIVLIGAGLLISIGAALLTGRFARRRALAEFAAELNRESYLAQRRVSEDLQHAILPKTLPSIPGTDVAARYIPGTRGIEIGGDWYSVVPVDEESFVFIVGDVSGHDTAAAAVMASLRYTTITLARLGMGPAEILERASAELDQMGEEHFATVLVGKLDVVRGKLALASAGHPAPLLVTRESARFVDIVPCSPLGVPGGPPQVTAMDFPTGAALVAFTDGLVEHRGEDLAAGLERLANAASPPSASAADLVERVLVALVDADHEDDIAVLVLRFIGSPTAGEPSGEADFPGTAASVPAARYFVRDLLERYGIGGEIVERSELCASELATNAVSHAHSGFKLAVRLSDEAVRIEVTDTGSGAPGVRHPGLDAVGGRGLLIVSALAHDWGVTSGEHSKTVWCTMPLERVPA